MTNDEVIEQMAEEMESLIRDGFELGDTELPKLTTLCQKMSKAIVDNLRVEAPPVGP